MSRKRDRDLWIRLLDDLRERGVVVEDGLTEQETRDVECRFGFRFPPDLRALLQTGLPVGDCFPDWRNDDEDDLRHRLTWPLDGIHFDIERNGFWLPEWGSRPDPLPEALRVAEQAVVVAPRLIPVYSHRYIPAEPAQDGNPVFSVYQTDIIVYGNDVLSYFAREFPGTACWHTPPLDPRPIRFWGELAS
jgi:hypothetical protein